VTIFDTLALPIIFIMSLVLFAAASEFGHFVGARETGEANIATLEASILGLLALMLSFTFAMAVARYDARREAVLNEANAIGTATLRARLLPAPYNATSLDLLRDYVGLRVELAEASARTEAVDDMVTRSNALQEKLWTAAKTLSVKNNSVVPTGLFIQSLNAVFDAQETRLTAFRHRVPRIVFFALYGIAAVGIGFSGYASGLEKRSWRRPVYIVNILAASVILLIQDIDRPTSGAVRVDTQPIIDTARAMATYRVEGEPTPALYR
jgi:hypothetical protein